MRIISESNRYDTSRRDFRSKFLIAVALTTVLFWSYLLAGPRDSFLLHDKTTDEAALLEIDLKIREHHLAPKEQERLETLAKNDQDSRLRLKYVLLLARNIRVNKKDPIACLVMLGPAVIPEDKVRQWKQSENEAEKTSVENWKSACAQAKSEGRTELPEKLAGILIPFPPFSEWTLNGENAECAVEIARAHMDMHDYQNALLMVDFLGKKFESEGRVLAAECAGDLMTQMQSYEKAVKFYGFGLDLLRSLVSPGEGQTIGQKAIEARLIAGLNEAGRLFDIDRYGAGYVLYRDAERKRRGEGSFLEALLLYEDLRQQFPKTVYSEAAMAYSIDCLFALADEENLSHVKATVAQEELVLKEQDARCRVMKKDKVDQEVLNEQRTRFKETERRLERLKTAPVGGKAANEAKRLASEFLAQNPYGLYRGETMLRLADYCLEYEFNKKDGLAWYQKSCEWFEKVKEADAQVEAFDVPAQAKAVSAPPPAMKCRDDWGNVEWSQIEIGKLFNQRTSAWYVPYHLMMARAKRSLCHFIMGDRNKALEGLDIILQVDDTERGSYRVGMPNSYSRLKAEFEQGRMFATQEELMAFKGDARTALLVAEYYFEIEQWNEAKRRYERIDRNIRGRLKLSACAYLDFMLGNCALMTGNTEAALQQYKKFETVYKKTPTWPRAMFNIFNVYQFIPEKKAEGLTYLRQVHARMPDTDLGQRAYYHEGEFWYANGNPDRAKPIFLECEKEYKGTWLARGAGQYLAKIAASRTALDAAVKAE